MDREEIKMNTNSFLRADELIQKPLNYEKYRDLENELNQQVLVDFIATIG